MPTSHYIDQIQNFIEGVNAGTYQRAQSDLKRLPVEIYTDQSRFDIEMEEVFSKSPIIIGHNSIVPRPGDHFVFDHLGQPLLVVRGKDDQVRVFYNICRHRGVRLVSEEGVTRKGSFVCPYHNWAYGLDGQLMNIPCVESFVNDDVNSRHLIEVSSAVAGGFIFANLQKDSQMDMGVFLGETKDDLEALGLSEQVFFKQTTRNVKANWKLIVEAFQDGYHVVRLHRNTVGSLFLDNVADIVRVQDHLRAVVARKGFETMCQTKSDQWDVRNQVSLAFYLFPNTIIVIHPDYISHLGLFPVSPDETICVHSCFLDEEPKTEKAKAHFERAFNMIDKGVFEAEDFFVCEQAQLGMRSGVNKSFPLSEHEIGIKMFHDILSDHLEK